MQHIILGLVIIAAGAITTIKSEAMLATFGRINFFERYLGTEGGSRLGYKLLGIVIFFIGTLVLTNLIGGFLGWLLGPLMRVSTPR
ncbi:MAG: hypothetical protein WCW77_01335 [Patescibacteria group bacterium]|jgi:hypothetical protein